MTFWTALVVLGAGLAAATVTAPEPPAAAEAAGPVRGVSRSVQVPVARATAACPDPVAAADTATRVTLAAPGSTTVAATRSGGAGSPAAAGSLSLSRPDGRALPGAQGVAPGTVSVDLPAAADPTDPTDPPDPTDPADPAGAVEGTGPLVGRGLDGSAPGLAAGQLTRSTNAAMRGLAGTTCTASVSDAWFVGSGAVVGQRGRVYLTNTEAAPTVVDLALYGPDGPIDAPDARGIAIAPGEQEVRLLDALAPGVERFAVHVRARQGRVSAAVRDLQVDGLTPLGADWVPAATDPALRSTVSGVPGGAGPRLLQVVAPGESDAIVRLRLVTGSGASAPAGLDVIEVPAGSVTEVDIAGFTDGEPVTVELESDAPVTAGVLARVSGAAGQLGEIAYAAAGLPLTAGTPGVVPEVRQGDGVSSQLLLTAPGRAATVELRPLPPATGDATRVRVGAGSLVTVDLGTVDSSPTYALVVVPARDSGPVYAVRQVDEAEARGPFVTSSPVEPGRYAVRVPRVVADLSTGLRAGR